MASSSSRAAASSHASAPAAWSSSPVAGCRPEGRATVMRGGAQRAVDVDVDVGVPQRRRSSIVRAQRREGDPGSVGRAVRCRRPGRGRSAHQLGERAPGRDGVDQAPLEGLSALHAFGPGGEDVGEVAPDVALVDHPGQAAGAREHGEQRHLGERHRRRPVVDEQDLVAGQRQLVAAAGGGAVDRGDPDLAGVGGGVLDAVAGLVGELAEVDLVAVGRAGQHLDVGPGAEHLVEPAGDDDRVHLGMLEAQPLHGVVELDVDGQVVGVQLQLVVVAEPAVGGDVHHEGRDRAVELEAPVAVGRRLGDEADRHARMLRRRFGLVASVADRSEVEDGGAGEPVVGEVAQGRIGLLERVRGGRHPDGDLRGDGQELARRRRACWP